MNIHQHIDANSAEFQLNSEINYNITKLQCYFMMKWIYVFQKREKDGPGCVLRCVLNCKINGSQEFDYLFINEDVISAYGGCS